MTTATLPTVLTPELLAAVRTLSHADKELLRDALDDGDEVLEPLSQEWKDEIRRRIEAYKRGDMKNYTLEEVMAHLKGVVRETDPDAA